MYAIDGRNRAITLAGQAFIALIPLLVVLSGWLTFGDADQAFSELVVDYFGLTGGAATAVDMLFAAPPDATGGITIFGFFILLFSVSSFGRSLQRMYELAWSLPPAPRVKAATAGFGGVFCLLAMLVFIGWIGHVLGPGGIPVQIMLSVPLWMLLLRIELTGRVDSVDLFSAAVVVTLVQLAAGWWTQLYVPHLIAVDAERYGVIGVAFAIVAWLVIVSYVLVGTAVVGSELSVWLREHGITERLRRIGQNLTRRG